MKAFGLVRTWASEKRRIAVGKRSGAPHRAESTATGRRRSGHDVGAGTPPGAPRPPRSVTRGSRRAISDRRGCLAAEYDGRRRPRSVDCSLCTCSACAHAIMQSTVCAEKTRGMPQSQSQWRKAGLLRGAMLRVQIGLLVLRCVVRPPSEREACLERVRERCQRAGLRLGGREGFGRGSTRAGSMGGRGWSAECTAMLSLGWAQLMQS